VNLSLASLDVQLMKTSNLLIATILQLFCGQTARRLLQNTQLHAMWISCFWVQNTHFPGSDDTFDSKGYQV